MIIDYSTLGNIVQLHFNQINKRKSKMNINHKNLKELITGVIILKCFDSSLDRDNCIKAERGANEIMEIIKKYKKDI